MNLPWFGQAVEQSETQTPGKWRPSPAADYFVCYNFKMTVQGIESLSKIRSNYKSPQDINKIHRSQLSNLDRLALVVTNKIGTMGFFFIILAWTLIWLCWNVVAPDKLKFDPYPAFVLWLFISNLIQIHLMPLIMIGQNIQGKHAEIRAEHDFQTDSKAEKEIETILLHLENQQRLTLQILHRIEKLEKR